MIARPEINFQRTPVTLILTALALAIEVVSNIDPAYRLVFLNDRRMGIWWQIWHGEIWRPLTTVLLHGGLFHALFNIYWVAVFGPALENVFGSLRTLALLVLFAYVSSLSEYLSSTYFIEDIRLHTTVVGLSGVLYGCFGLCWIGSRYRDEFAAVCDPLTVRVLFGWFVLCFPLAYLNVLPVANIAHAAGLGLGILIGLAIYETNRRVLWIALAALFSVTVLATLIAFPTHPAYEFARRIR